MYRLRYEWQLGEEWHEEVRSSRRGYTLEEAEAEAEKCRKMDWIRNIIIEEEPNYYNLTINKNLVFLTSKRTQDYTNGAEYDEIFYDENDGRVWNIYRYNLGHNQFARYAEENIHKICEASRYLTEQEIIDRIKETMEGR